MFMDIMKGLFICRYAMKHVYVLKKKRYNNGEYVKRKRFYALGKEKT